MSEKNLTTLDTKTLQRSLTEEEAQQQRDLEQIKNIEKEERLLEVRQNKKKDLEKAKTLMADYGFMRQTPVETLAKLDLFTTFLNEKFGWNVENISFNEAENTLEFTVDGKEFSVEINADAKKADGTFIPEVSLEKIIEARYAGESKALERKENEEKKSNLIINEKGKLAEDPDGTQGTAPEEPISRDTVKNRIERLKNSGFTQEQIDAMSASEIIEKAKDVHRYGKSDVMEKGLDHYEAEGKKKELAYLEAYQKEVEEKGFFGRNWSRLKDWLGRKHKDTEINERLGKIATDYEESKLKQNFIKARLEERKEQMRRAGKSESEIAEYMQRVGERYSRMIVKVDQLEKSYKEMSAVKREIWGYPKNKLLENISNGAKKLWETKAIKNSIGNKWFRFALGGAIGAFFTGGVSWAFMINRLSRLSGGMIGGAVARKLLVKYRNEEKKYTEKLDTLTKGYQSGKIKAKDYTEERNEIERNLTAMRRVNQFLVAAAAYGTGMAVGALENSLIGSGDQTNPNTTSEDKTNTTETGEDTNENDIIKDEVVIKSEAYIGKGEGIEHALIRQIEDPDMAKGLGYEEWSRSHGLPADYSHDHLHKFAGIRAHQIAIDEGYVDPQTGQERWVYGLDKHTVAYALVKEPDGSITIHEYVDGAEKQVSSSTFETDIDRDDARNIYEKTHGRYSGYNPVEHQGGLSNTYLDENNTMLDYKDDEPIEEEPFDLGNDGDDDLTHVNEALGNKTGIQGDIEKAPANIPGQQSNYDYVQRPGLFGNRDIVGTNGANTQWGPGTRYGVNGTNPFGDTLKAVFNIFSQN